jgi:hypothetical protein
LVGGRSRGWRRGLGRVLKVIFGFHVLKIIPRTALMIRGV